MDTPFATPQSVAPSRTPANTALLRRGLASLITLAICMPFALSAQKALEDGAIDYGSLVVWQSRVLVFGPVLLLGATVAARRFRIAVAIYWAWSFVFLGMAPAFQLSRQAFPWKGVFQVGVIEDAQTLVLIGHGAFAVAVLFFGRSSASASSKGIAETNHVTQRIAAARQQRVMTWLGASYVVVAVIFVALMGPALFQARAVFRSRVLEVANLPLGGFLYFAVTAGAIVIPAALIAGRRRGLGVSNVLVVVACMSAAIVTNPLVGSRFLCGSFLVAIAVALLDGRYLLRLVPMGSIVLLVVLFPSLDVLRGDDTGSAGVSVLEVESSMLDYDFDAFEMGLREVSLTPASRDFLPSTSHMLIAPIARWIPFVSRPFIGDAGGQVVAQASGMMYTNVSMPLWAEGHLIAGTTGTVLALSGLGAWLGLTGRARAKGLDVPQAASLPGSTALLFIVLRGSIYEVLGYLMLAMLVYYWLARGARGIDHG